MDDYLEPMPVEQEARDKVLRNNFARAISSCVIFLCSFSYLKPHVENSASIGVLMQRAHRVWIQLTLIYMCFMIFMLNMRPDYGRYLLSFFDTSLDMGVDDSKHTYDDNCEFYLSNIWDNIDHYFVVHLCDWFLATLVIRDPYILHFWHLLDEVIELSWQHILPHFAECWWDHIFLDICMTNIPAICFGLFVMDKCGIRRYDWLGRDGKDSI